MNYSRPITFNERLFLVNSVFRHRDAIQILVKLEKDDEFELETLKRAIQQACEQSGLHRRKIIKGEIEIQSSASAKVSIHEWDKEPELSHHLFNDPIDYLSCLIEHHIILFDNYVFLLVKSHHVLMDGAAYVQHLKDIFSALRNEEENFDLKLYQEKDAYPEFRSETINKKSKTILSKVPGVWSSYNFTQCISLPYPIKNLSAILSISAAKTIGRKSRFIIPFDLRKFQKCPKGFGNMTLPIYLDVHPNQNIKEINIDLNNQINHKAPLSNSLNSWILGLIPHFLLVLLIRLIQKMSTITGLYFSSGFLSDLGRQKLMDYSAPGLEALDLTPIPMVGAQSPYSAFTLTHEKGTRVGLAVHAGRGIELWKKNLANLIEETKANIVIDIDIESYSQQTVNIIIKAWSHQLKIDPDLCHSNYETSFSDLGGDSLSLVLLFTEVQDLLSRDDNSPIAMEIFSHGTSITIKQMAHLYSKYS